MSDETSEVKIMRIDVGQCNYARHIGVYVLGIDEREGSQGFKVLDANKGWVDAPSAEVACIREPSLMLTPKQAQALVNSLWDSGIRPEQAKGSSGQLEAVNKHLEDMRKIAFLHIETANIEYF